MRSFLKIFITVVVLAGGFVAYLLYQPGVVSTSTTSATPAIQHLQANAGDLLVGHGENAWVRQFDDVGRLSSRFRAQKWDPQKNGLVRVTRPEAELYVKGKDNGRGKITIQGTDGEVVADTLPDAAQADSPLDPKTMGGGSPGGPAQPPSSGRLNGVVICVYETESATEPAVTLRTNNIVFDNETFRISTETYTDADGTVVSADQVAVSVEGRDFDFYGRGLTVRWNDVDERLELLRIAHGDRLVVKNPGAMSGSLFGEKRSDPKKSDVTAVGQHPAGLWAPLSEVLVSADPQAAGAAIDAAAEQTGARGKGKRRKQQAETPQTRPARRKDQPPYKAAFHENVRVLEGEQALATADLMNVEFLLAGSGPDDGKKEKRPTTRQAPATAPAPAPALAPEPTTAPADERPGESLATTELSTPPAAVPTTAPAPKPITIYWVGELTVTPIEALTQPKPLGPGEAGVELVGTKSPVVLTRDNSEVRCAHFAYRTDGTLLLEKSDAFPQVELTHRPAAQDSSDAGPSESTTVTTESVHYSFAERLATLRGRSRVKAPIESKRPEDSGALDAAWADVATFHLAGERQDELWVEKAEFAGDVDVAAPQGKVKAQQLALLFDPPAPDDDADGKPQRKRRRNADGARPASALPATQPFANSKQPSLRRVIATDHVSCELTQTRDGRHTTETVECQRLELETAKAGDGKLFPRLVDARGSVRANGQDQELKAGHVVLTLKPAPRKEKAEKVEDGDAAEVDDNWEAAYFRSDADDASVASVALESMVATEGVQVTSKDGVVATGKRLQVAMDEGGDPHVELSGEPARVVDAHNGTVTGRTLLVDPRSGVAHVPGEGSLTAVQRTEQEKAQGKPGRPVEVTWEEGADLLGADNRIDVAGKVSVRITELDGTVRTANAGKVSVELVDKFKPGSAAKGEADADRGGESKQSPGAARADANDEKAADAALNMDVLKDKEIGLVTLRDDAVVNSERVAPGGAVVQRIHLKAPLVTYDVAARQLAVPGAGRMLVENHQEPGRPRAAKRQPRAAKDDPATLANGNGATAFEWARALEFDMGGGRAVMRGAVVVTHQPDEKDEPPVRLDADELTAAFAADSPAAEGEPKPAAGGATPESPKFEIKSVRAVGNVSIARQGAELTAGRIDYDPSTQWVIARGDERNPAAFSDPHGTQSTTARELWLNTKTWRVTIKGANVRVGGVAR